MVLDAIKTEVCRRGINKCRAKSTSGERSTQRLCPESLLSSSREAARSDSSARFFPSAIYRTLDRQQHGTISWRVCFSTGRTPPKRRRWRTNRIDRNRRQSDFRYIVELVYTRVTTVTSSVYQRTRDPIGSLFGARLLHAGNAVKDQQSQI